MTFDPNLLKILAMLSHLNEQEVEHTLSVLSERDHSVGALIEEVRPAIWRLVLLVERIRDTSGAA